MGRVYYLHHFVSQCQICSHSWNYRTILNQSLVECSLFDSLSEFASKLSWLPLLKTEKKIRGNKIKNKKYHRVEFEPSYGRILLGLVLFQNYVRWPPTTNQTWQPLLKKDNLKKNPLASFSPNLMNWFQPMFVGMVLGWLPIKIESNNSIFLPRWTTFLPRWPPLQMIENLTKIL